MLTDLQARDLLRGLTHAAAEGASQREVFSRLESMFAHDWIERHEFEGAAGHYFDALDRMGAEIDQEVFAYWFNSTPIVHRSSFGMAGAVERWASAWKRGKAVEADERATPVRRRRRRSLRARGAAR